MMNDYFSKELLGKCQMTEEEFSAPIETLKENTTYVVGTFSKGNVVKMITYKDGYYYISDKVGIQSTKGNFKSLSRAYAYFEELYYK